MLKEYGRPLGYRILENAHTRRRLQDPSLNDTMRMILVGGSRSKRFARPIRLNREFCDGYFLDKHAGPWKWDATKTELQTMASYLRSVRIARHPEKLIELLLKLGSWMPQTVFLYRRSRHWICPLRNKEPTELGMLQAKDPKLRKPW